VPETSFSTELLNEALSSKCDGMPDHEIIANLLEQGVSPESADEMMTILPLLARQKLEAAHNGLLMGIMLLTGGIGIRLILKNNMQVTVMHIASWVMIGIGILKLVDGLFRRSRYRNLASQ
jgi:hypothetical protein